MRIAVWSANVANPNHLNTYWRSKCHKRRKMRSHQFRKLQRTSRADPVVARVITVRFTKEDSTKDSREKETRESMQHSGTGARRAD